MSLRRCCRASRRGSRHSRSYRHRIPLLHSTAFRAAFTVLGPCLIALASCHHANKAKIVTVAPVVRSAPEPIPRGRSAISGAFLRRRECRYEKIPHSDTISSSFPTVFFRRSSSLCLSFCTIVSFTTRCWSSRTSMTNSLLNSLSMLTMMDLIEASHSTRTPVKRAHCQHRSA